LNSNRNARFDSVFDSNANGRFAGPYLGVYLNHDLKWSHHIDQVAAKAAKKLLGFVRCNLRGSPVDYKKLAYIITLVRSGMEYASVIWDPYTKS